MALPSELIVLYSSPLDSSWARVIADKKANPTVKKICIVNVDSGPGTASDSNYASGVISLQAAGIQVVGYVPTGYSAYPRATIDAQMQDWKSWYNVNGILFDEMSNLVQNVTYYQQIAQDAKNMGYALTAANPGTSVPSQFLGIFDILVIYEGGGLPNSVSTPIFPGQQYALVAFGVPSISSGYFGSISSTIQWVYVTDALGPPPASQNPYDVLPTYFEQETAMLVNPTTNTITIVAVSSFVIGIAALLTMV